MKNIHMQGWFSVRASGLKLEVTYCDGRNTYCKDLRTRDYAVAAGYCRAEIERACQ